MSPRTERPFSGKETLEMSPALHNPGSCLASPGTRLHHPSRSNPIRSPHSDLWDCDRANPHRPSSDAAARRSKTAHRTRRFDPRIIRLWVLQGNALFVPPLIWWPQLVRLGFAGGSSAWDGGACGRKTTDCLIPGFDGAVFSREWRQARWAKFSMVAPRRQRRSVERYSSQESLRARARRYGINQKTVAKWKQGASVADLPTGPKAPRSSVLAPEEEAIIVAFRRRALMPLDDCLYALQAAIRAGGVTCVGGGAGREPAIARLAQ